MFERYGEEEPGTAHAAPRTGPAAGTERRLLSEVLRRVESIDSRLSAVEQRVGTGPDVGDLDQEIGQVRHDKESAIIAEDFENAATLRDRERQLLAERASRQDEWATAHPDLPSLAERLHRLSDEVERLRDLLRRQGIEPQDGTA
jgi:hypothetical protein